MISTFTFTNQIAPCIVPFIQGTTHRITPCPHTHTHARTHTHAHQLRVKDVHNTYAYSLQAFVLYICIFYIYLYTIDSSGTERVCVCVCVPVISRPPTAPPLIHMIYINMKPLMLPRSVIDTHKSSGHTRKKTRSTRKRTSVTKQTQSILSMMIRNRVRSYDANFMDMTDVSPVERHEHKQLSILRMTLLAGIQNTHNAVPRYEARSPSVTNEQYE